MKTAPSPNLYCLVLYRRGLSQLSLLEILEGPLKSFGGGLCVQFLRGPCWLPLVPVRGTASSLVLQQQGCRALWYWDATSHPEYMGSSSVPHIRWNRYHSFVWSHEKLLVHQNHFLLFSFPKERSLELWMWLLLIMPSCMGYRMPLFIFGLSSIQMFILCQFLQCCKGGTTEAKSSGNPPWNWSAGCTLLSLPPEGKVKGQVFLCGAELWWLRRGLAWGKGTCSSSRFSALFSALCSLAGVLKL